MVLHRQSKLLVMDPNPPFQKNSRDFFWRRIKG